jgi:hypothetical protein
MLLSLAISALLVAVTVFTHYEVLRLASIALPLIRLPVRLRILVVVFSCLLAHTIEVWGYALVYFGLVHLGHGALEGNIGHNAFAASLYFSITSYSTLGYGDIYPTEGLRLIAGIEALNGLFLVAWPASFTYLAMERLWPLHVRPSKSPSHRPHGPVTDTYAHHTDR